MNSLEELKSLGDVVAESQLPSLDDVKNAEKKLGVTFPPSYVKYQLEYSHYQVGALEPYLLFEDGSNLDLINSVKEARDYGLPQHLLPFVEDNGDYFCFDLCTEPPEYEVVYWSHNGTIHEKWTNFLDWVERCWIEEERD